MTGRVQNNTTINNYYNINIGQCFPVEANQALNSIRRVLDTLAMGSMRPTQQAIPACGCMRPPSIEMSASPAGRGLAIAGENTTGEKGWPANTVTTAGGYHVVARGGTNWDIYSPGQVEGKDPPSTHVWGDPHVVEKDGRKWDFTGTKGADGETGNDFVLGDGTRIFARTSSDKGHSVTTGLEITNGTDHVSISGADGSPKVAATTQDGYEWRARHVALAGDRASFYMTGDANNQHWLRERHGRIEGEVTGTNEHDGSYDQTLDTSKHNVQLGGNLRPPFGSRAWGNMLRDQIDDGQARFFGGIGGIFGGELGATLGAFLANQGSYGIHENHIEGEIQQDVRDLYGDMFRRASALRTLLISGAGLQSDLQLGRATTALA